jgi:hypothetical protein
MQQASTTSIKHGPVAAAMVAAAMHAVCSVMKLIYALRSAMKLMYALLSVMKLMLCRDC